MANQNKEILQDLCELEGGLRRDRLVSPQPMDNPTIDSPTTDLYLNKHEQQQPSGGREQIVEQLEMRASRAIQQAGVSSVPLPSDFARSLEKLFYKQSGSLEEHTQLDTIDARLNDVLSALLRRQQARKNAADRTHSSKAGRGKTRRQLKSVMSAEQYKATLCILQKVSLLKASLVGESGKELPKDLPAPVREFFFRTRLIHFACHSYPQEALARIDDWGEIIQEARENISTYEAW
eukprot:CAMPEP_0198136862 /NCGR_PEP_ID=MMETSP1443-20131203/429_1 /TAXON_ID=186043 /ORGANISM="Entomoneis sp., Strain CCMP2396" /LENGTH=235 /DNA_ID=CAMNT_0043798143 /DNA_START=78 /DNA_END=782 /DNA_ORIENTATION=+